MIEHRLPRRGFLGRVLMAGAALGLPPTAVLAAQDRPRGASGPDEEWLRKLDGKHRQLFDTPALQGGKALSQAKNFLDAYNQAYGMPDRELSVLIVAHGGAFPLVFDDATWERFGLGERFKVQDAATGAPARRNVFSSVRAGDPVPAEASVVALQRRGVVFVLCNNTLKRTTGEIAKASNETPEAVRSELLKGLLPGVSVVPAAVLAINRAQEHGLTYVYGG